MTALITKPIPPVPTVAPITPKEIVTENWSRWFMNLRDKVNVIDAGIISIAKINSPGTVVTDGNGNFSAVHLTPGTYGSATQVPVITVGAIGDITNITTTTITATIDLATLWILS